MSDRDDDTRDDGPADGEEQGAEREAADVEEKGAEGEAADVEAEGAESEAADVEADAAESGDALDDSEADQLRVLLRGALDEREEPAPDSRFLKGVQRRLRERSGGKFYADGWSTAKHPPIGTYFVTSFIMLLVLFAVYTTLTSLVGEAVDVENTPAPVRIVFPKQQK